MTSQNYLPIIYPKEYRELSDRQRQYNSLILDASRSLLLSGCKSLPKSFDITSNRNYFDFISWCYETSTPTGWELAASLIKFLDYRNIKVTNTLAKELLLLSCSQWTYSDKSAKVAIVVAYGRVEEKLFGAIKSRRAESSREVFYIISNHGLPYVGDSKNIMYWVLDTDSVLPNHTGTLI